MTTPAVPHKYWAFISYSHLDKDFARALHQRLERYKLPKRLVRGGGGAIPTRLFPIFLDVSELPTASNLNSALQEALDQSRALVVVSSPNAVQSPYVEQEVRYFKQRKGTEGRVLAYIVGGEPNAYRKPQLQRSECFVPSLTHTVDAQGNLSTEANVEPLGADIRLGNSSLHDATLKTVAGILGLDFDVLKQRDKARRQRNLLGLLASVFVTGSLLAGSVYYLQKQHSSNEVARRQNEQREILQRYAPFPRLMSDYSEEDLVSLRQRIEGLREVKRVDDLRYEGGVGRPGPAVVATHNYLLAQAELAWAQGQVESAEKLVAEAVTHAQRLIEIESALFDAGWGRSEDKVRAFDRERETQNTLNRLRKALQELRDKGFPTEQPAP